MELDNPVLQTQLQMLWIGYDATREQVSLAMKQFSAYAGQYPIIKYWCDLPGVGLVRATTIFAYLDTPWRFKKRSKLHKYCGVGLVRITSGKDKKGRPRPPRLKLPWAVNRRIKNAVMGAATTAIEHSDNVFKDYYERMLSHGITPSNARHSVARKMVSTMVAMWKTNSRFDEKLF
jgi:transposase